MGRTLFISYSHDSPAHLQEVRDIAESLRSRGFDVLLDQFEAEPVGGWAEWSSRAIEKADSILLICSTEYCDAAWPRDNGDTPRPSRGVGWEAGLIRNRAYRDGAQVRGIYPVFFDERMTSRLPLFLQGLRNYLLPDDSRLLLGALEAAADRPVSPAPDPDRVAQLPEVGPEPKRAPAVPRALLLGVPFVAVACWIAWTATRADAAIEALEVVLTAPIGHTVSPLDAVELRFEAGRPLDRLEVEVDGSRLRAVPMDDAASWRVTCGRLPAGDHRLRWTAHIGGSAHAFEGSLVSRFHSRAPDGTEILDDRPDRSGYATYVRHAATGLALRLIPADSYSLRSEATNQPDDTIDLERPFYIATTEVTVGAWRAFADASGHRTPAERNGAGGVTLVDGDWPAYNVPRATWHDPMPAQDFVPSDRHPVTQVCLEDARSFCRHHGLRLPTEPEWEIACGAGSRGAYWWGDDPAGAATRANVGDVTLAAFRPPRDPFDCNDGHPFAAPVASYAPNALQIYDTLGNVWEWCEYSPPQATRGALRGGSWGSRPSVARVANRLSNTSVARSDCIGFRVVIDVP